MDTRTTTNMLFSDPLPDFAEPLASPTPARAKTSKTDSFFVRINNSTRHLPDIEIEAYIAARWSRATQASTEEIYQRQAADTADWQGPLSPWQTHKLRR